MEEKRAEATTSPMSRTAVAANNNNSNNISSLWVTLAIQENFGLHTNMHIFHIHTFVCSCAVVSQNYKRLFSSIFRSFCSNCGQRDRAVADRCSSSLHSCAGCWVITSTQQQRKNNKRLCGMEEACDVSHPPLHATTVQTLGWRTSGTTVSSRLMRATQWRCWKNNIYVYMKGRHGNVRWWRNWNVQWGDQEQPPMLASDKRAFN